MEFKVQRKQCWNKKVFFNYNGEHLRKRIIRGSFYILNKQYMLILLYFAQEKTMNSKEADHFTKIFQDMKRKQQQQKEKNRKIYEDNKRRALDRKKKQYIKQKQLHDKKKDEQMNKKTQKQNTLKLIEPYVKQYRKLIGEGSNTEISSLRRQSKITIFKYLMYGIEELTKLRKQMIQKKQTIIVEMDMKSRYNLARNITTEIDLVAINKINKGSTDTMHKNYKNFLKTLTACIEQDSNLYLRRKILTRQFSANRIIKMDQQQFYPLDIQNKIRQRNNILIKQSMSRQYTSAQQQQLGQACCSSQQDQDYQNQASLLQTSKEQELQYELSQFMLIQIKQLLSEQYLIKIKNTIPENYHELHRNFQKVFNFGNNSHQQL